MEEYKSIFKEKSTARKNTIEIKEAVMDYISKGDTVYTYQNNQGHVAVFIVKSGRIIKWDMECR